MRLNTSLPELHSAIIYSVVINETESTSNHYQVIVALIKY